MAALPRRAADAADQSVASSVASCWQRRPGHPAILAARLAASTAAREVMRSTTAVRQRRASWKSAQAAANVLVRELYGLLNGQDSRRLFADHGNRLSKENGAPFSLVRGRMVGLGGLEPPTSSLSAIARLPLCNPAFL